MPGASAAIAGKAEDMIKTVIVPVVTLVLGDYSAIRQGLTSRDG